jgi:hypothetical protein
MRAVLVVGVLTAVAAASAAFGGSATRAPAHGPRLGGISHSTSTNWSGYAVTAPTPFTDVKGSWVEPAVSCGTTAATKGGKNKPGRVQSSYAAFWVGLDGYSSSTVEQTGTDSDCNGATPTYYAWYEFYPAFPVNFSNPVQPGDTITAEVNDAGGVVTVTISDTTRHWTQTATHSDKGYALSSAEWIAEAPSSGQVLPLANFGTVDFSNASATGAGTTGPISAFTYDPLTMVTKSGQPKATPSALGSNGTSFSVTWSHS